MIATVRRLSPLFRRSSSQCQHRLLAQQQTQLLARAVWSAAGGAQQAQWQQREAAAAARWQMEPAAAEALLAALAGKPPVVFYHYPCPDGVFAALAATLFYRAAGVQPRYVPLEVYRTPALQELQLQAGEAAFLLDYAGPEGFAQQLAGALDSVVVLDHHKTAAQQLRLDAALPSNLHVCLDMQRSGATIARDFFRPQLSEHVARMFQWVEDADLWRWALPDSQAFHAGLADLKLEYHAVKNPGIWQQLLQLQPDTVIARGRDVLAHQERLINSAVAGAQAYQLGGAQGLTRGWGCCLGCRASGDLVRFRSMLGNRLALASKARGFSPVGLVAYTEPDMPRADSHVKVSLRAVDDFDTSRVSEAFGGGGHAAASSCIVPSAELAGWRAMGG